MQDYNEPSSRMIRLPVRWSDDNVPGGGATIYSNRQTYNGERFNVSGSPLQHPQQQVLYPPVVNSRLPVFHLRSSAPMRGTILQGQQQQLGLATGISASSSSQRKSPANIKNTKTIQIPPTRRQRKSVINVRKCSIENELAVSSAVAEGNASISKRPRGRPPGKRNKLPTAHSSPAFGQSLGTDASNMMKLGKCAFVASNGRFEGNPYHVSHWDRTKYDEFINSQKRCMNLIEYIRDKTQNAPERFNQFLDLMKHYRENGDWRALFESTDNLFHEYPSVLTAVKELVSNATEVEDSPWNNYYHIPNQYFASDPTIPSAHSNLGLEMSTQRHPYFVENYPASSAIYPEHFVPHTMTAEAELTDYTETDSLNRSDHGLCDQEPCVPNALVNVPNDISYEVHSLQEQCVEADSAVMDDETPTQPKHIEDMSMRENILEVCGELDDEKESSTSSADGRDDDDRRTHVEDTQKTCGKKLDFHKTPKVLKNRKRTSLKSSFHTKKSGKLSSDPMLYRLLSAIHLFGTTKNNTLFKNNGRSLTHEKLKEKLTKLILNEIDETRWKTRLLCAAYPALEMIPHFFHCLQVLLQVYDPLSSIDAEGPPIKTRFPENQIEAGDRFNFVGFESFKRVDESYYQYPDSFVHPNHTGIDELGLEVLNDKYVSVPSASVGILTREKSHYEKTAEMLEDVRYELDMLDLTCTRAIEELKQFGKENVVPKEGYKTVVQLIYANNGKVIVEGIQKQPELFIPPVLQRLEVTKNEWTELRNRWNANINEKLRDMCKREDEKLDDCQANEDIGESARSGKVQFFRNLGLHSIK